MAKSVQQSDTQSTRVACTSQNGACTSCPSRYGSTARSRSAIWWIRGGAAEVAVYGYAITNLSTAVGTALVAVAQAADWTSFTLPAQDLGDASVEYLKVTLTAAGGETYWDNLRLSVDVGTNRPSMRFHATPASQGLAPQYIFGVDADYNRKGDRLAGTTKFFYLPYDITPPAPVQMPGLRIRYRT